MNYKKKVGAALLEVVVATGIFALIFYLTIVAFVRIQRARLLADNAWRLVAVLRETQSRAASGEAVGDDYLSFGVLFTDDYYQEFATLTDYSNRQTDYDLVTNLSDKLEFINFNLPDNCLGLNDCIIFSPIEGVPATNGNISLRYIPENNIRIININNQGQVSF